LCNVLFKPTPPHRNGLAPAACLCEHCSELVLLLRCKARDSEGRQCGSWQGHRHSPHTLLVDTTFLIALERVDRDRWGELPSWVKRRPVDTTERFIAGRPTLRYQPKRRA
jgi:hypothetical protein